MHLETERLVIRDWQPIRDARQALDIYGDEQVTRWLAASECDRSIHETQARLHRYVSLTQSGLGAWAVVEKAIDHVIGTVLLIPLPQVSQQPSGLIEIGWHFRPASWGYGYATEAAQQIIQHAFETVKLSEIYAVALPGNLRSIAVMKRLGMTLVGLSDRYHQGAELMLYCLKAEAATA
ncbi:MAG: GNAT family N-acetyltransferase [Leptolyngbya sp. SIO4C1]|nr:GNAT family N-acetyltransferase [Leptolyngbya sp. SIO4C1]